MLIDTLSELFKLKLIIKTQEELINNLNNDLFYILLNKNNGEKDEIRCIKHIYSLIKTNSPELYKLFGVKSNNEIIMINPATNKEYDINEIVKTPSQYKADVILYLNTISFNVSIKSIRCSAVAIINHTHRNARVFKTTLNAELPYIDEYVAEYIKKRDSKIITEDISLTSLECFKDVVKESIITMLVYFIFSGTGSQLSKLNCDSIIEYD